MKPEMPDRVSADLRKHLRLQERHYFPENEKHIQQAREEIIDAIMDGLGWKGHGLSHVIERYLDVPTGTQTFDQRISEVTARLRVGGSNDEWLRALVEEYVPAQWIEDRASEIARG